MERTDSDALLMSVKRLSRNNEANLAIGLFASGGPDNDVKRGRESLRNKASLL